MERLPISRQSTATRVSPVRRTRELCGDREIRPWCAVTCAALGLARDEPKVSLLTRQRVEGEPERASQKGSNFAFCNHDRIMEHLAGLMQLRVG